MGLIIGKSMGIAMVYFKRVKIFPVASNTVTLKENGCSETYLLIPNHHSKRKILDARSLYIEYVYSISVCTTAQVLKMYSK